MESAKARAYERMYPNTGIPEAQKEERFEREEFKRERLSHDRTTRTRGILIPRLPYKENR